MAAPAPDLSKASRGCWRGLKASVASVEALVRARKMPAKIEWRIPGDEMVPQAEPGERVVFLLISLAVLVFPPAHSSETS